MPRPRRKRRLSGPPTMDGFKPFGIPMNNMEPVSLLFEEYESIRLADYMELNHEQAAERMNVSRATFTRIYEQARRSIAKAFMEGNAILIEGGDYHSDNFWYRCNQCMKLIIHAHAQDHCIYCQSKNIRMLNKQESAQKMGQGGHCICVHCGTRLPHLPGQPCRERECPECGKKMMREGSYHHQLYLQKKGDSQQ